MDALIPIITAAWRLARRSVIVVQFFLQFVSLQFLHCDFFPCDHSLLVQIVIFFSAIFVAIFPVFRYAPPSMGVVSLLAGAAIFLEDVSSGYEKKIN